MRKALAFVLLLLSFLSVNAQDNVVDEIVWVIGDEAILRSDVEEQRMRYQYEGTKIVGDPYCFIPEQLALQKLYLDQAKIDSVTADEKSVSSQVEMRINYLISQVGSKEKVEEYFKKPMPVLKEELREMVNNQQVILQMQRKIAGEVKVTPAEVSRYFKTLPEDSVPTIPAMVEVQVLSVQPKVTQSAIDDVKARLRDFQSRIESGDAEFSTLAILYSEDTESAKRGGEIGYSGRGQLVPEYANVAFGLQDPKKVSKIVESEFGFHIIQLIDRKGERVNTRHILLKPRVSLLEKDNAKKRLDSIAEVIRKNTLTFDESVFLYSDDKNTKNSLGLMTNPKTGATKFQLQELPPEVAKAVYNMKTGEISEPFPMIDSRGREVYAIVKLKSSLKTHKANIVDDYLKLKDMCVEQKRNDKLEKWVKDKQSNVYVRIDEKWRNCEFQYPGWVKE
ncbi:MAG TPA: peptidylprolyl isomerase [Paludibacteraceae bacterium]|nr:peptidylprolyl isomerase [Paludibacteraceae bacterium]HOU67454.1 peptidylprolyl isomerase [Paludibacteraceae bacterium]HPH63587.1 peptidylprolyl isomerase [Paludibacteraceae bacterium]HQF50126.1 peptidylprolyl isomerase [Paludibacteraceae bacterium]HQJ89081.1 peptidylprolyl isomerase [Paludibacteraceae bacterium]